MKRSEILAGSPILIAALATVIGVVGSEWNGAILNGHEEALVVVQAPAPSADVPLIGELTVTANRG